MFDDALELALEAHRGQKTADGRPYILHPLHVALKVAEDYDDEAMIAAALLHDVVEDGNVTVAQLQGFLGLEVSSIVDSLSRREGEKYMDYIRRLAQDDAARAIKIQDLLHNMDLTRVPVIDDDWILQRTRRYHRALRLLEGE